MHAFTCSKLSTPASNQKWEVEVGIRAALLNFKVWLKRKTETAIWMIQVQNFHPPPTLKKKNGGFWRGGEEGKGLLGIRRLLTHLEPLVHPKYTPAKKVTMVSSGSLPHIQTQWRGTALPRPFPKSIHPAAALLEKRTAPSPRGAWVGKVGPLGGQSQLSLRSAWGYSGG